MSTMVETGNFGQALVALLIAWAIGAFIMYFILKTKKFKNLIPPQVIMIAIGVLLAGSTNIADDSSWWHMTPWVNPIGTETNAMVFSIVSQVLIGALMFRAGSEINVRELKEKGASSILLGIIPCTFEGIAVGSIILGFTYIDGIIIEGMPWAYAYAMGFAIASATPGIIMPLIFKFKNAGFSKKSGINEGIIVGSALDNVTSLAIFIVFLNIGVTISSGSGGTGSDTAAIILGIPWLFIYSGIVGLGIGLMIWGAKLFIDNSFKNESKNIGKSGVLKFNSYKVSWASALFAINLFIFVLYALLASFPGYSDFESLWWSWFKFEFFLVAMVAGFVVSYLWSNPDIKDNKEEKEKIAFTSRFTGATWTWVGLPIIFINVGASIDIRQFASWWVLISIFVLIIGLLARQVGVIAATASPNFTWKERLFGGLAFIPKGTSTAGAIILAQSAGSDLTGGGLEEFNAFISSLLLISTVAIIFTIPLSQPIAIYAGPRLLVPPDDGIPVEFLSKKQKLELENNKENTDTKDYSGKNKPGADPNNKKNQPPKTKTVSSKSNPNVSKKIKTKPNDKK